MIKSGSSVIKSSSLKKYGIAFIFITLFSVFLLLSPKSIYCYPGEASYNDDIDITAEAALLGIPAISCYPREPTIVEEFLIREKLIQRTTDSDVASLKIVSILNNFDEVRSDQIEKANDLIKKMEDPFDIIIKNLEVND